MKLITCACLFVTLLTASNAFMDNFDQEMQSAMDEMDRHMQDQIEKQLVAATGKPLSVVREMLANSQQSISCNDHQCNMCDGNNCKACSKGSCVPCGGKSCSHVSFPK